ncbi:hypothetical protein SD70_06105 [Gordoniibacillus kamchatkensis]|uniref:Hemerythrin-like domain-containing protein n=1 Tax=Gordoniibacillus kamchatkensis TaxID=1590651 RepID=A0ABR5AMB1_9BACL|nr:hypothetical protein [Paenibacillus sp. VKM B-2647]KIL41680.1 hypothetical protein SD70_06105 [Paenibacillus sp. VKM B-2647]
MAATASQSKRMLDMGRVSDLPQILDELEDEHRSLAQEWKGMVRIVRSIESGDEFRKEIPLSLLNDLQHRAADFLVHADDHIQKAERLLVPDLDAYFRPEDTMPSIHFANMMMEEQYEAAKQLVCKFIQKIDMIIEPIPAGHGRYLVGRMHKGLNMIANYLNIEYQYMLPPAERMAADLESWHF